jgi:hypothetical protein
VFGLISFFGDGVQALSNVLRYTGSYQAILGILYLFGHKETYPIMQQEKDGRVHGEHLFKSAWIMPVAALSSVALSPVLVTGTMIVMLLFCDLRINRETPKKYFRRNGIFMVVTGLVVTAISFAQTDILLLMGISIAAAGFVYWIVREALFVKKNDFLFVADDTGIQILYVYDDTPACEMKMETGDKIIAINDRRVVSYKGLESFLEDKPPFIWVKYERDGKTLEEEFKDYANGIGDIGIVPTPKNPSKFELYPRKGFFAQIIERLFSKKKDR